MLTAVVCGAIANKPFNGGEAWVRLSWILGLRRLGFEVYFIERLRGGAQDEPDALSAGRAHLQAVVGQFGLSGRAALIDHRGRSLYGLDPHSVREILGDAEAIFDISGNLGETEGVKTAGRRVYVDLDPGFTQTWHRAGALGLSLADYDAHVTVGCRIGAAGCLIQGDGLAWIPTPPPVVLEQWQPRTTGVRPRRFTTVSTWRSGHGAVEVDGHVPGLKHHEFRRLIDLPGEVEDAHVELALDIRAEDRADLRALESHGWHVRAAREVASTPDAFRDYVRGSFAELSVAQPVYVQSACGWFSDRTAAYLAAGRPAVVQDTGIGALLPTGEGIVTFDSPTSAAEGVRRVLSDPTAHEQAARRFAAERLDSDRVLATLLGRVGVG